MTVGQRAASVRGLGFSPTFLMGKRVGKREGGALRRPKIWSAQGVDGNNVKD